MKTIQQIRKSQNNTLVVGNHSLIIQSILDFDYLTGKEKSSVMGIIGNSNGYVKMFWGKREILIPQYAAIGQVSRAEEVNWFLNLLSGRRALSSGNELIKSLPNLVGGVFFAEGVAEQHSLELYNKAIENKQLFIGPASVGLTIPGILKLGPIGGITPEQIAASGILEQGDVAVMSASGGMTNELINLVTGHGSRISFALSFGGDRFPLLTPENALALALEDPNTKTVLYYGELGGDDEYKFIDLLTRDPRPATHSRKNIIVHIAGTVADLFPESPQFGHAKAKATTHGESARAKRDALKKSGVIVTESFGELGQVLNSLRI